MATVAIADVMVSGEVMEWTRNKGGTGGYATFLGRGGDFQVSIADNLGHEIAVGDDLMLGVKIGNGKFGQYLQAVTVRVEV